jgi:quercetin dioxygenase-like cupin family protein
VAEALPGVSRDVLFDVPLAEVKNTSHVEARRIRMGPGVAAGLHVHNTPVVGNIAEGSVVFQIEGEPATVLRAGDVFFEPQDVAIARFDAQDEGAVFYAYFLLGDGEQSAMTFPGR